MRYAIVSNGRVTNVVIWNGSEGVEFAGGTTVRITETDGAVGIGWSFDAASTPRFTPPEEPDENV